MLTSTSRQFNLNSNASIKKSQFKNHFFGPHPGMLALAVDDFQFWLYLRMNFFITVYFCIRFSPLSRVTQIKAHQKSYSFSLVQVAFRFQVTWGVTKSRYLPFRQWCWSLESSCGQFQASWRLAFNWIFYMKPTWFLSEFGRRTKICGSQICSPSIEIGWRLHFVFF